jgi:hypothetical protein
LTKGLTRILSLVVVDLAARGAVYDRPEFIVVDWLIRKRGCKNEKGFSVKFQATSLVPIEKA